MLRLRSSMRGWCKWLRACVMLAVVVGTAAPTAAADDAESVAQARALFDEAKRQMSSGDYAAAAARLEESLKRVRGKGTLFQLGVCYEKLGRYARAWAMFTEAADAAKRGDDTEREGIARTRASAIADRVPHLTIVVSEAPPGFVLRSNGDAVASGAWGLPLPVDPGTVHVEASAPGRNGWETNEELAPGESKTVRVPALEPEGDAGEASASVPATGSASAAAPGTAPAGTDSRSTLGVQRGIALATGGLALAGVVAGIALGLKSNAEFGDAAAYCTGDGRCSDPRGVTLRADSVRDGNASTIAFVAAGVVAAGAVVLWFTAPRRNTSVGVSLAPGVVKLAGAW